MKKFPPLTPELNVKDLHRSLAFYVDLLGFSIEFERPKERFATVSFEGTWLMLEQTEEFNAVTDREFIKGRQWRTGELVYPFGRGINFQVIVKDIDTLYVKITEKKYPIKFPIEERSYRVEDEMVKVRQFMVMDPDGYLLRFSCDVGRESVA